MIQKKDLKERGMSVEGIVMKNGTMTKLEEEIKMVEGIGTERKNQMMRGLEERGKIVEGIGMKIRMEIGQKEKKRIVETIGREKLKMNAIEEKKKIEGGNRILMMSDLEGERGVEGIEMMIRMMRFRKEEKMIVEGIGMKIQITNSQEDDQMMCKDATEMRNQMMEEPTEERKLSDEKKILTMKDLVAEYLEDTRWKRSLRMNQ